MAGFHEGFNLYNLGFTGGILGAVITSILKLYNFQITPQRIISTEFDLALKVICSSVFLALIIIGFFINNSSFKGYMEILKDSGLKSDFVKKYGFGLTFINMGIMGFVATGFVILIGETLNGPLLAGILTVVGFSAYGKHFKNTIPILIGVYNCRLRKLYQWIYSSIIRSIWYLISSYNWCIWNYLGSNCWLATSCCCSKYWNCSWWIKFI